MTLRAIIHRTATPTRDGWVAGAEAPAYSSESTIALLCRNRGRNRFRSRGLRRNSRAGSTGTNELRVAEPDDRGVGDAATLIGREDKFSPAFDEVPVFGLADDLPGPRLAPTQVTVQAILAALLGRLGC